MVFTVTGFGHVERDKLCKLVMANGGAFLADLEDKCVFGNDMMIHTIEDGRKKTIFKTFVL